MPLEPGLLILNGNRLELLGAAVFEWLRRQPLAPLEEELILVQSNGMAEWVKMELAAAHGVCAATRVELPARFIWRAYRAVLGRAAVPALSPLDKLPLTWRLMRLLPALAPGALFAPVAGFLQADVEGDGGGGGSGGAARRLQLAARLADLFDQYQVYRADWLQAWDEGRDVLPHGPDGIDGAGGTGPPVPADQRWQPALWRALQAELTPEQRAGTRARLHQRFMQALGSGQRPPGLPRRVVLFGTTHVPQQTLQALAALSAHCQVLMAVPNPCRFHWADTLAGRELLQPGRRRLPLRGGRDLAAVPLQDMHAHGHPLLSAWGHQVRDFVRQLDAWEDTLPSAQELPRVELFDGPPPDAGTLLQQVQAGIRELLPLAEQPRTVLADGDRSIVFHVAHSAQREVEVLHDQLLQRLGSPGLQPRDIVVMVPDIESFAPAIQSVFGQYPRGDARHIPFGITDQRARGHHPIVVALEWLLRAPAPRASFSELRDLLDVPALARRLGLQPEDLPLLTAWMQGAGIRWGLHQDHRAQLGLGACGDVNSAQWGLHRMLLGYASGDAGGFAGIEPYAEVAGLSAALAGALADLLQRLQDWWRAAAEPQTPAGWAQRCRALLQDVFEPGDDTERAVLAALDAALSDWLQACELAPFDEPVGLDVLREAWLQGLDDAVAGSRFKAGGVTFCTLLPLRSIPFEVVCLLGMNDGDYPRRSPRADFDLMALPGQARAGDRTRRDDDRQLMLDALLAARSALHVSWAGHSPRDNSEQPPSVLVAQLRDHLARVWGAAAVEARTVHHPLQPFSRRYFEPGSPLFTHAVEWRRAHAGGDRSPLPPAAVAVAADARGGELTVATLAQFMSNPVKAFFRHRLQVVFDDNALASEDDEVFGLDGLQRWQVDDELLRQVRARVDGAVDGAADGAVAGIEGADLPSLVDAEIQRLARSGRLPLQGPGRQLQAELRQRLQPMLAVWQAQLQAHPQRHPKRRLQVALAALAAQAAGPAVQLQDWLVGLRSADGEPLPCWIELQPGKLTTGTGAKAGPRGERLTTAWVRALVAAAAGQPVTGIVIGADAWLQAGPPEPAQAPAVLADLLQAWADSILADDAVPLPTAVRTGLAALKDGADDAAVASVYEGTDFGKPGEGREACLARLYPDFEALTADARFLAASHRLYGPFKQWLETAVTVHRHADGAAP